MLNHTKKEYQKICELYTKENLSCTKIAKLYDTYNTSIRRILLKNNIEIRTQERLQTKKHR
jgi:hypothetical protein